MSDPTPSPAGFWSSIFNFFQDDGGGFSMMRLVLFIGIPGTLFVWACVCAYKREFIDLPPGVLTLHGGLIAGKMVQNKQEGPP